MLAAALLIASIVHSVSMSVALIKNRPVIYFGDMRLKKQSVEVTTSSPVTRDDGYFKMLNDQRYQTTYVPVPAGIASTSEERMESPSQIPGSASYFMRQGTTSTATPLYFTVKTTPDPCNDHAKCRYWNWR